MSTSDHSRASQSPPVGLVCLLVALVAVRFFRLGEWGLWIDEAFTLNDLRAALSGREGWPSNPLGYRMVAAWLDACGASNELALRTVPALFGAALLPLAWWALRPFTDGRVALLAAVFLGANTWTLYWAQNARFYSIAQTLGVVGVGCFARALFGVEGRPLWRALVWLLVALASFALAALAHPSALLFAAGCGAAPLLFFPLRLRPGRAFTAVAVTLVVLALGCAAVAAPWAGELWQRYQENKSSPSPLHFVATTGYHVTPWVAVLAGFGLVAVARRRAPFETWLALSLLVVLALALALSLQARVSAQYVFVAVPAVAWLAAVGVEELAARRASVARFALWGALALSCADEAHYFFARNGDREHWREAYQFVWNSRGPNDLIVGMAGPVGEFYLAPDSPSYRQPLSLVPLTTHNAFVTTQWARRGRRIWYVVLDEWLEEWPRDERARLERFLATSGRMLAEFPVRHPFRDLTVRVWLVE
jgi:hypothetical protein